MLWREWSQDEWEKRQPRIRRLSACSALDTSGIATSDTSDRCSQRIPQTQHTYLPMPTNSSWSCRFNAGQLGHPWRPRVT